MTLVRLCEKLDKEVAQFLLKDFNPRFDRSKDEFPSNAVWKKLNSLGSELWFDTGDISGAEKMWTREFSALTTNNTLLNKEVQTGVYDDFIVEADKILKTHDHLEQRNKKLEMAFILNVRHALRLVEKFDAYVSVEEHTDLASDVDAAVEYAIRYHEICPQRFIVKIPFTPAGILATYKVAKMNIPVNHTLGFSARQNYVIARIAKPRFVNVFLGRLNSFAADNGLGSGKYVGEKATLASQAVIRGLREMFNIPTRQIGASFRNGEQVRDLAGLDVMTMPLKAAQEFLDLKVPIEQVTDKTQIVYQVDAPKVPFDTLWNVDDRLVNCLDELDRENLDLFSPDDLVDFFDQHGCGDVLVKWTQEEMDISAKEGKIPKLENWKDDLSSGRIGLDSLMNLAGLNSFMADQKAMDDRVENVLKELTHAP